MTLTTQNKQEDPISNLITIQPVVERGLLVGVELKGQAGRFNLKDSLAELARLADTAGVTVVGQLQQSVSQPNPATLIGSGKVQELVEWVKADDIQVVIFDEELSPAQQREIEKAINDQEVKVLDRTALILDIFAQHAHTKEGALQVELAQYEYRLPRLTRAWTHLARQAGGRAGGATGGVGVRGPGETQLESDRREIGRKIAYLRRELEQVREHREQYRARRRQAHIPIVALVGYTNAGKSTLINALSEAEVLAADQLFATLDPTTRRMSLPSGREALITDTVGFIQKLPTQLVAAFRATLEEILEADLILHVVDASHGNAVQQAETVIDVLTELQAERIPMLVALNKIDLLDQGKPPLKLCESYPQGVSISALRRIGLSELAERIDEILTDQMIVMEVLLPYSQGDLVDLFHRYGVITREEHRPQGTILMGRVPTSLVGLFEPHQFDEMVDQPD